MPSAVIPGREQRKLRVNPESDHVHLEEIPGSRPPSGGRAPE